MQTEYALAIPAKTIVIRIAGLPMEVMERLRLQRTTSLIAELLGREQQLQTQAEQLSETLYQVIGAVEEKRIRGGLMALRRAIYQLQSPKQRDLTSQVWAVLPEELAARIATWLSQLEEREALLQNGAAALEAEVREKRPELLRIAQNELFQQGLVLASKDLYADLLNWLRASAEKPDYVDRQLELGLMTYISRAATKTSPFSTFTSSGRGRWVDEGSAFQITRHWSRYSVVALNQVIMQTILRALTSWPEVRASLPLRINSSLTEEGASLSFLGHKGGEAIIRLSSLSTLQQLLLVLRSNEGLSYGKLVQELAKWDGAQERGEIARFLDQLIAIGLLEAHLPVADQALDHLSQLLRWLRPLRGQRIEKIAALLQELHTYLTCYPTKRAAERFELLERISATIEQICQQLAQPQPSDESTAAHKQEKLDSGIQAEKNYWREIQTLSKNTLYEDTMVAAIDGQYGQALWQQSLEDLALIQQLSGLYTIFLSSQLATTAFFVDHYGSGASIKLLRFYEAFCKERHQPGGWRANYRVSGAHLPHMLEKQTVPLSLRLPELDQVLALRQEIYRWMEEQAVDGEGVRLLNPARLRAFVANFPSFVIPPRSLDFYCQILLRDGIPSLVLNALHSGFGRSQARLQRLESLISGESQSASQRLETPILIDIAGAFNSNVNLRVAQTAYEIAYPGVVSARPPEEQLPLTDLSIVYASRTRRLQLVSERLGQEVQPVHLGLMADFWLPALSRFLLRTFSVGPANPTPFSLRPLDLSPVEAERPIKYYPRLTIGRVMIERATWIVGAVYLPRHEKGTSLFAYMLCLQRWLKTHGLPQQCFVRILSDPPVVNKNRKPLYIDFSNHLGVMMFEQLVNQTQLALLLQEVLPGQPDLAINDGTASYVSECIFELTLKEER